MRAWRGGLVAALLSVSVAAADQPRIAYTLGGMPNMPDGDLIIDILTKRLQAFGLTPSSRQQGTELRVEFDDRRSPEEVELLLTRPGALSFHSGVKPVETCTGRTVKGMVCLPSTQTDRSYLMRAEPDMSGDLLDRAEALQDTSGFAAVNIFFDKKAQAKFSELTLREKGNFIAVVIDEAVVVAPRVMSPIYGPTATITGLDNVETWSVILSLPPLPRSLMVLETEKVSQ